ncbi:MAG: nuclear transport factor 2 family protein [Acidimicrobiia bacterium]
MAGHDHYAIQEFIQRYWFHYDEGHLDVLRGYLADDCHLVSRTELGTHPYEEFIGSDNRGVEAAMAWTKDHREHSPYPLRHMALNVWVREERGEEVDAESYLFVTQVIEMKPSPLSSGLVHWTLRRVDGEYLVVSKDVVLDSIESAEFHTVDFVKDRMAKW